MNMPANNAAMPTRRWGIVGAPTAHRRGIDVA
jgi:hypothetical protein